MSLFNVVDSLMLSMGGELENICRIYSNLYVLCTVYKLFLLLVGVFLLCLSECKNWMLGRRKEISTVCSVSEDGASPAHGSCAGHAGGAVGRAGTGHRPGPGVGHAAGPHAVEGRGGGGLLVHAGGHSAGGAVAAAGHVDLVDGLLDDDLTLLHILDLLAAGAGGREHALTGSELVEGRLSLLCAGLGALQLALELLHAHNVGVRDGLLLLQLALVHLDLLVKFVQGLLQDDDVLPVLLRLKDQLLDASFLLVHLGHGEGVALLLAVDHGLQFADSDLHLLDGALAGGNGGGLDLLDPHAKAADLVLKGLLGVGQVHNLGLLLAQQALKVLSVATGLVGTVIGQLELPGDIVVVPRHGSQFLLQLHLDLGQVVVDGSQLVGSGVQATKLGLVVLVDLDSSVIGGPHGLELNLNLLQVLDGDIVLLERTSKLLVDIIVGSSQLHNLLGLHLGSVLQLSVALVGGVQGHLQLGDGHGHLLLDNLNLVLQSGIGLGQLSGQHVDLHQHLLLLGLEFGSGTGQTLLGVGTELGQLLLKLGNTVQGLLLSGVGVLVGTGQLLTLVTQLPVVAVQLGEPLLEGIKLHLHGLEFILQLTTDTGQTLVGHLQPVHLVGDLENLLGASLAVTVSALVQVGHLLQLGTQLRVALVGATELLSELPNDDLAVLDVLDEDGDLLGQLVLLALGGLQLLLQSVQVVGESIDLNGELLLENVGLLHPESGLVLVLLLPFSVVSLPLLNGSLQLDLDGSELLDLDVEGLDVPLQAHDLGLRSVARSGFRVSRPAELLQLDRELVLVHAGVLDGQLHLVQLLVGLLGLHLELLLAAGHVHHGLVQSLDLHVVLVHGNLNLLLVPGHPLDLLLQLHHGSLVFGSELMDLVLGLGVDVLQQLPQLGHLSLALPVNLEL